MPTNRRQRRQRILTDRALDETEAPDRRLRAAKALVELADFSRRPVSAARKVATDLLGDQAMPQDIRKFAVALLEKVAVGEARRANLPEPTEDELDLGTAAVLESVYDVPPARQAKPAQGDRRSYGFTNFEQVLPFILSLDQFDFDDPHGFDALPGRPWQSHQDLLMESIVHIYVPHNLYRDTIQGEWDTQRNKKNSEYLKRAVVMFADRNIDPTQGHGQYRIDDWKIVAA
jgi:hypothetical protein